MHERECKGYISFNRGVNELNRGVNYSVARQGCNLLRAAVTSAVTSQGCCCGNHIFTITRIIKWKGNDNTGDDLIITGMGCGHSILK